MACGPESREQICLFEWAKINEHKEPALALLFHVPNGGKRSKTAAVRLKLEGVKAGVPDLVLPVARGGFHGLFIELKEGKNTPTQNQKRWLAALSEQGYCAKVCYGFEGARDAILEYLNLETGDKH